MPLLRLLTVDDEKHIHAGLDAIVDWRSIGFEHVGAALNGAEALQLVSELSPDVVLTDIRMPGVDGLELIEKIRTRAGPQPAIVVISGYGEFEYARSALRHGVQDYLLKPIEEDDLIRVLEAIRRRLGAASEGERGGPLKDDSAGAVRTLLAASGSPDVLARARAEISAVGGGLLSVVRLYYVRDDISSAPLSASQVRGALSRGKARESSRWVVDDIAVSVALLLPTSASEPEAYRSWMKGLKHSIEVSLREPVVLWASGPIGDAAEIHGAVDAVKDSIGRSPHRTPGALVILGDESCRGSHLRLPVDGVVSALEEADRESATNEARTLLSGAFEDRAPVSDVREWLAEIRVEVSRLFADLDAEPALSDSAMRSAVYQVYGLSFRAVWTVVEEYLREASDQVLRLRQGNRDGVIALMRRRIERDFSRELSIASMAEQYEMNPVYLGQLFKKKSGVAFKTALRRRRIREARLLLEGTDLLVPDIARAVGYRDRDFFTDQFKREIGVTPGQYRDRSSAEP
jgi:two-component system response regulator YesN